MPRALLALVLGAVAGAAVTYFVTAARVVSLPAAATDVAISAPAIPSAEPLPRNGPVASGTAERAALYDEAAGADGAALARLIAAAAAAPPTPARTYKLGVLLARYAELDAERALALARELRVGASTLASLYAQWAAADPADALAALGDVQSAADATTIGLALLPVLGGDDYALRQVLAALPQLSDNGFRVAAIAELASSDPAAALERALELPAFGVRGLALERVGAAWARIDPGAALAAAEAMDDSDLRSTLQSAALNGWARMDPNAFLDYVVALDPAKRARLGLMGGLFEIARLEPERYLELSKQLPAELREPAERQALSQLARSDPEAALERLRAMPPGIQQDVGRQEIARAYGSKDPDAALAWAKSTGDSDTLGGVLSGIASKDPSRAFDVAATLSPQDRTRAFMQIVNGAMGARDPDFAGLAERLLAAGGDAGAANGVTQLVQTWQRREPQAATEWIVANAGRVPAAAFQTASRYLAENDLAAAERLLPQIPSESRSAWLQGMAQSYARNDAKAGAAWVARLRGDPAYAGAAGAIAQSLARVDAPAAAALLDGIPERGPDSSSLAGATSGVAAAWARSDPLSAAEWARGIGADARGVLALSSVARVWADRDYAAARAWTLGLPSGPPRDAALRPLLMNAGNLDTSLLASFSSDATRQTAVLTAVTQLAGRDPKEARALVDRYVTLPSLREQADRALESGGARRIGSPPF
ncbi:MAG TPA: hypothetical protein VFX89_21250 [Gammaproteobacteria bacterium]|nr:hypothetical protein [Gammaproteobacteria bacterium]